MPSLPLFFHDLCCLFVSPIDRVFLKLFFLLLPIGKGQGAIAKLPDRREEDTYQIEFPNEANEQERALLLASAFLMDYALYDEKEPQKQNMA